MKNRKFFWQIFPAALLIIITSVCATTWYGTRMVRSFYYDEMQIDIKDRALLVRPQINLMLADHDQLQEFCRRTGRAAATRITVIGGDGVVLADSNEDPDHMDNHENRPEALAVLAGTVGSALRFSKTLGQNMLYVAIPLHDNARQQGILRLSVPATALDAVLSAMYKRLLLGTLFIAFTAAVLSYLLARRISNTLEEMRQGAERLASGETDQPILIRDNHVPRELTELSHSLNHMAEQLNGRINMISQQRNELEAVFTSMTEGVLAVGSDHKIIRINRSAAALFHIDSQGVKGKPFEGIIRNRVLQQFLYYSLETDTTNVKNLILMENGSRMTLRCHAQPLYDGEDKRMGSMVVLNNLTRINQLENIRQDFVANVSHELKTPITAIRGYVETLLDGAVNDPQAAENFLQIILRQGARLDAIVDDLLTLARVEDKADKNEIELHQEKILPILEAAVQTCAMSAEQKNITIDLECDADIMAPVNSSMLEQAIINLLTNAVTYSPENSRVRILAKTATTNDQCRVVQISLEDQGCGIAPEHQERVFERFYRCDKARSREHGGTGLGLSIVKHIAASHNGSVEVQSQIGQGSTFILTLPLERKG